MDELMLRVLSTHCPFCGNLPEARDDGQTPKVNCVYIACPIRGVAISPHKWIERSEGKK